MAAEAPLVDIEVHHVPTRWAEERGRMWAERLGAGALLILPEAPDGPQGTMQVILFPHPDDIANPDLTISNITEGDISWQ